MAGLEGMQLTSGDAGKCSPAVQATEIEEHTAFSAVRK